MSPSPLDLTPPLADAEIAELSLADRPDTPLDDAQAARRTALRATGNALRAVLGGLHVEVADAVMDLIADPVTSPALDLGVREAVAGRVDLVGDVMERVALLDDALSGTALACVLPAAPPDLADSIFAALEDSDAMLLSAFGDGELEGAERARITRLALRESASQARLQANGRLGAQVREAATGLVDVDLWSDVARGIGATAGVDEGGGDEVGDTLREALGALPVIDVAPEVMASVLPKAGASSRWLVTGGPLVALAMAAMVLLTLVPGLIGQPGLGAGAGSLAQIASPFVLSSVNDATVEDLETSSDVVAQVVQFDDGGPTFILVDEPGTDGGTL